MRLSFVPTTTSEAPDVVRVVRAAQNIEREPTANDETLTGQASQRLVRAIRTVRVENGKVCRKTDEGTCEPLKRNVLQFKLDTSMGGNAGGTVISDDELIAQVLKLVARYGQRLDLDDLTERVRERFAIAAEDGTEAEARRIALDEIELAIKAAKSL